MAKLSQILAVEKGVKAEVQAEFTRRHHDLQKSPLLSGISRKYSPYDEEGEMLPSESVRVQLNAEDVLSQTTSTLTRLFDVVATKEAANCKARANVVVDGNVLLADVPVTYLLFLEKQLVDLRTFVRKLPVLDAAEEWHRDDATDTWKTSPVQQRRTKKVLRNHVKAEATDRHPAQVDVYTEDIGVGTWTTVKYSGAVPARRVNDLLERVTKLQEAVKFAREEANSISVTQQHAGDAIFGYLLG